MKKLIAVVLILGIVFSMFSVTAISSAAAATEEVSAASSETVGAPDDADEYLDISLGETATGTAVVKRKFTPAKTMVLKLTVTTSVRYLYSDVCTDNETLEYYTYKEYDGYTEYFYGLKANETVYIGFGTYRFQYGWSEPSDSQMVDISIKPEECTEWTEITMDKTAEYDYPNSKERYYFYFVAPEDMYAHVNYLPDGTTTVWFRGTRNNSPAERYFSASGSKKRSTLCKFTAGNIYMMMCEYSPGYREQQVEGKMRVWLEKAETISVGETKQLSFSDTTYAKSMIFTPDKDSYIKYTPVSASGNDNTYFSSLSSLSGDSEASGSAKSTNPIIAKVTAGQTYLFTGMFEDLGSGSSEVKLEEYTPGDIAVNEVVNAQISDGSKDYFRLVPDRDVDVIIRTYRSRISLRNESLERLTPLNGTGYIYEFYRLIKGETYYVIATGASDPLQFCISEIQTEEISLNESHLSPGESNGKYYFYTFTPDTDMVVSVYFSTDTVYDVDLYTPDWKKLTGSRVISRDDYTFDLVKLTKQRVGTEKYFLLNGGKTYLFALYCDLSSWSANVTADFNLKKKDFKDIGLNEYQSLYNHIPNEYNFFRFTPDETCPVRSELTKDEDDTRSTKLKIYDSNYKLVSSDLENIPAILKKGETYYLIGYTPFDLYCDDLECGFTLVKHEIKTIRERETVALGYGEIARFSPDKMMLIRYKTKSQGSEVELLDGDFNCIESALGDIAYNTQLVNPGETYYIRNNRNSSNDDELTITLIGYPEIMELNQERVVTIDETTSTRFFLFTPETDMTVEYYGYLSDKQDDQDIRPAGQVWDPSFSDYNFYCDYDSFSTTIDAEAGVPILLSASLSSYGDNTGSFTVGLRSDNEIFLDQTREINSGYTDHAEKTFIFNADQDILIQCTARSNYMNVTGAAVKVEDTDGTVLAEDSYENDEAYEAAVTIEAEKGKTYKITASFDADDDNSFKGKLTVAWIKDIHLGDAITENRTYRFIPDKDVFPVVKVTTADGEEFYDSVAVLDEDFENLHPYNNFGGDYFALYKSKTYYIIPASLYSGWDLEDSEVVFCEPETIEVGETKSAFVPGERDWLYQITCDEDTVVKFSGTGEGRVIAFLRDSYGDDLRNSVGVDDVLFSFGYTLSAGEKYMVVVNAYDDTDIQVTAAAQDDFEVVDDVIVKYYGKQAQPTLPRVSAVGEAAFLYSDYLERLVIPDTINEIRANAFTRCYSLTYAQIPGSVKKIGNGAFEFDTKLKDLKLGEGITEIGSNAFEYCIGLSDVKLPQTLTTIGNQAFLSCSSLNDITIPKNVTSIGEQALGYYFTDYSDIRKKEGFTIRGYKGTAAERYALDNGFRFIDLEGGEIPEPVVTIGDVTGDGKITIDDATMIQKYLAEMVTLTGVQQTAADANGNGSITIDDATMIQKYLAEMIDHLGK